jgi:hypothetical protein
MGLLDLIIPARRAAAAHRARVKRWDLLNHLIDTRGYRRYLEIGVRDPSRNFDRIRAAEKTSVDPSPLGPVTYELPSDEFFARLGAEQPGKQYDLVFIDGLHLADQVERDVENSLRHLAPGGTLVLHDCNPESRDAQTEDYDGIKRWNGTVWKAWAKLRATRADLAMAVVDIDDGCGVITRGSQQCWQLPSLDYAALDYSYLRRNRRGLLNLVPVEESYPALTTAEPSRRSS